MNPVRRAWRVLRRQGPRALVSKVTRRLAGTSSLSTGLVRPEDVLAVDWRKPHHSVTQPRKLPRDPLTVAWIMSPPGTNSGGHQNIFRFISFLEGAGHTAKIYLDSAVVADTPGEVRARVASSSSYPDLAASIESYEGGVSDDVDVIVATGWETAYLSYLDPSDARRLYFVQDFEPLFYAMGSEAVFAENTYRFGFTGITAGGWLAGKLHDEYGMRTTSFPFGTDEKSYSHVNGANRNAVFFYARPETPRRGFELGLLALELVTRERPGTEVIMAGQALGRLSIPFPHENPGNLQVGQLNAVYNRCAAGLVLSLTNMSLLPIELLSAGVIPVVNDGDNNRLVSDNPFIAYSQPSPRALADSILEVLDRSDQAEYARRAASSVESTTWTQSAQRFLAAFEDAVRG